TCGVCGGGFGMVSQRHVGCSNARNRGQTVCTNMLVMRRDTLENTVLAGLRTQLTEPKLVKEFIAEFHAEMNRLMREQDAEKMRQQREIETVSRQIRQIIEAIKAGMFHQSMKAEMDALEARKSALEAAIEMAPPTRPRLHPNLAELYRQKVVALHQALTKEDARQETTEILRSLIDEIRLVPDGGKPPFLRGGTRAAIWPLPTPKKPPRRRHDAAGVQVTLVAGRGFEPLTFRL